MMVEVVSIWMDGLWGRIMGYNYTHGITGLPGMPVTTAWPGGLGWLAWLSVYPPVHTPTPLIKKFGG